MLWVSEHKRLSPENAQSSIDDTAIARLLQQKELQEEKKRKKHYPESQGHTGYEESYYAENGGMFLQDKRSRSWQYIGEPVGLITV